MTKRQLAGLAVFWGLLISLAFFYWLAPILDYTAPKYVFFVGGPLISIGWVAYYRSDYAKRL